VNFDLDLQKPLLFVFERISSSAAWLAAMVARIVCSSVNIQDSDGDSKRNYPERLKHKKPSQPFWLLILEIATGVLVLVFLITCMVAACNRCKRKSYLLSWRKIPSWNDHTALSIG
ncbi:hypothetical protein BHE74_00012829, partial [Ensete ventricosum]